MRKSHSQENFEKQQKILRDKSKGYWRVKCLSILNNKLNINSKNYHALHLKKKIQKHLIEYPSYFQVQKYTNLPNPPPLTSPKLKRKQSQQFRSFPSLFLTTPKFNKSHSSNLYQKHFDIPIENFTFAELPFFYYSVHSPSMIPRTFKQVLEDSKKLNEFEKKRNIEHKIERFKEERKIMEEFEADLNNKMNSSKSYIKRHSRTMNLNPSKSDADSASRQQSQSKMERKNRIMAFKTYNEEFQRDLIQSEINVGNNLNMRNEKKKGTDVGKKEGKM